MLYFSAMKSTIKEKLLYDSSLSEFFSLVRKERKGQKEEGIDSRLGDADRVRLRESVNSPLEKANSYFRQRRYQTHARHTFICGRADNACTNLLGFFV